MVAESCVDALSIDKCAENIKKVYKANYPEQADIIDDVVDIVSNNEVFVEIFEDKGISALQIIEDALHDALDSEANIAPQMQTDDLYISKYVFPNVQQMYDYYCGPAATLMALIGGGASGYYYTNNKSITNGWQNNLAHSSNLGTTQSNGTTIDRITKVLSEKIPASNGYSYKSKVFTYYSWQQVLDLIETSLVMDAVPVLRINTGYVNYYQREGYGSYTHYIVVESVDFNAECVNIVDPHHNDTFFGAHQMSFEEFNNLVYDMSVNNGSNFWVSIYTKN